MNQCRLCGRKGKFEGNSDRLLSNGRTGADAPAATFGKTAVLEDALRHLLLLTIALDGTLYTERIRLRETLPGIADFASARYRNGRNIRSCH